jgi:hypothetical protein
MDLLENLCRPSGLLLRKHRDLRTCVTGLVGMMKRGRYWNKCIHARLVRGTRDVTALCAARPSRRSERTWARLHVTSFVVRAKKKNQSNEFCDVIKGGCRQSDCLPLIQIHHASVPSHHRSIIFIQDSVYVLSTPNTRGGGGQQTIILRWSELPVTLAPHTQADLQYQTMRMLMYRPFFLFYLTSRLRVR